MQKKATVGFLLFLLSLYLAANSSALTREQVIATASSYATFRWNCTEKNSHRDFNRLVPATQYRGISYNMGGFDTPTRFKQKVEKGVIAGNALRRCGKTLCIRRDLAGLDCSGFISRCLKISRLSSASLPYITIEVSRNSLESGDILNYEKKHTRLFDAFDEDGQMWIYESTVWVKRRGVPPGGIVYRAIDWDENYIPRRFYKFINKGESIKVVKPAPLCIQPGGKSNKIIPPNINGTIQKGPLFAKIHGSRSTRNDVWYYIKYDNGSKGWSPIRYLSLTCGEEDKNI